MKLVARFINEALRNKDDEAKLASIKAEVVKLMKKHPYLK